MVRSVSAQASGTQVCRIFSLPPSPLRGYGGQVAASVDNLRAALPTVAHALVGKRERRLVDLTGIEPVTS